MNSIWKLNLRNQNQGSLTARKLNTNISMPHVAQRPFIENQPKMVILLAYQRTGSTLTGLMLQKNPKSFYMFEPGDSLYQSLYGTAPGFTVPSDIYVFPNGSTRNIPLFEKQFLEDSLMSLLTCDLNKVPIETLTHPYYDRLHSYFGPSTSHLESFLKCTRNLCEKKTCRRGTNPCVDIIKETCPFKFSPENSTQITCYNELQSSNSSFRIKFLSERHKKAVISYKKCLTSLRQRVVSKCLPILQEICDSSTVRIIKTVRITMETAEAMMDKFDSQVNLRIIHLVRDPRGVIKSKENCEPVSMYSKYSHYDNIKESRVNCEQVLRDLKVKHRIESKYPGSTMTVIYEELLQDTEEIVKKIYEFLGEEVPENVLDFITDPNGVVKRSSNHIHHWQTTLNYQTAKGIMDVCSEFFNNIKYPWL